MIKKFETSNKGMRIKFFSSFPKIELNVPFEEEKSLSHKNLEINPFPVFFPIDLTNKKKEKQSKTIYDSEESEIIPKSFILNTVENEFKKKPSSPRTDEAESNLIKKIIQFYFIKKFIDNLKKNTSQKSFHEPKNKEIIKMLDDKSFIYEFSTPKKNGNVFFKYLLQFFSKFCEQIKKETYLIIFFNSIQIIVNLIYMMLLPLNICFPKSIFDILAVKIVLLLIYFNEILVDFNVFNFETKEKNQGKNNYIMIFADFIVCLCLIYDLIGPHFQIAYFFFFCVFVFKIMGLKKKVAQIEIYFSLRIKTRKIMNVGRLLFMYILGIHTLSCLWLYFGIFSENNISNSWLSNEKLFSESDLIKYINSLYFIISLITAIGLGDIKPGTHFEKFCVIFILFLAFILYMYYLNVFWKKFKRFIRGRSSIKKIYEKNKKIIEESRDISYLSKIKILDSMKKNYKGILMKESMNKFDEIQNEFFDPSLKLEIKRTLCKKFLGTHSLFKNFSNETQNKIMFSLEKQIFLAGDILFENKPQINNNLFFIDIGEIELSLKSENSAFYLKKIKNDEILNEKQFFTEFQDELQGIATKFTILYKLKKENFIKIIKEYPKDFQMFCEFKDKIIFKNRNNMNQSFFDVEDNLDESILKRIFKEKYTKPISFLNFKQKRKSFTRKQKKTNSLKTKNSLKSFSKMDKIILSQNSQTSSNSFFDDSSNFSNSNENVNLSKNKLLLKNSDNLLNESDDSLTSFEKNMQREKNLNTFKSLPNTNEKRQEKNKDKPDVLISPKLSSINEMSSDEDLCSLSIKQRKFEFNDIKNNSKPVQFDIEKLEEFDYYFKNGNFSQLHCLKKIINNN